MLRLEAVQRGLGRRVPRDHLRPDGGVLGRVMVVEEVHDQVDLVVQQRGVARVADGTRGEDVPYNRIRVIKL